MFLFFRALRVSRPIVGLDTLALLACFAAVVLAFAYFDAHPRPVACAGQAAHS
jgi:hypothetical protein